MENNQVTPMSEINPSLPMAYTVIIEWDGDRPPTRWYNRLKKLGISIRGDKEQSPLTRRMSQSSQGVALQEGALVLESESEARALAHLAYDSGAVSVSLGRLHFSELRMTHDDEVALRRISKTLGRRGRPPEAQDWLVTCLDEGITTEINISEPVQCPSCGGFRIQTKLGKRPLIDLSIQKNDLMDAFAKSRMLSGYFVEPKAGKGEGTIKSSALSYASIIGKINPDDARIINMLSKSKLHEFIHEMFINGKLTADESMKILDIGFFALTNSAEVRQNNRLDAITEYFRMGYPQNGLRLNLDEKDIDIFEIIKGLWTASNPLGNKLFILYANKIKKGE